MTYHESWTCAKCGRKMAKTWSKFRNLESEKVTGKRVFEVCGKCFDAMVKA